MKPVMQLKVALIVIIFWFFSMLQAMLFTFSS